ncbi:hypothetical protein CYLTODRAFT_454361 [Cylindrobasidium torrendii FP15055 ss-10]|uniref:Transmembrane protein n=1 Tax=Cylindrobasidium torrendii FP15055 ss-10 TaxID=1314674 RepID=A0A0D7BDA8_9AGAR|nr:hypothetical protein CYLTODRAFT_454361 [Cylindrobasidium torrendii FP15055 ss-10]
MGSVCLSAASILRCSPLSWTENIVIIVPPAVQLLISFLVIRTHGRNGSKYSHLLIIESCISLLLAILDLVSHTLPAVRDVLPTFTALDIALGALSVLPITLYMLFLFLFVRSEAMSLVPTNSQKTILASFALFIPAVAVLNEVASLLDIHRSRSSGRVVVGFRNGQDQSVETSLTLAAFATYQAMSFALVFSRLIKAILTQKSSEKYQVKGTGWITAGVKIGAIETVVGFAEAAFPEVLSRRILRLIGRACIVTGIIKGLDGFADGDAWSRKAIKGPLLISAPQHNTFRQLSPTATSFHTAPRALGPNEKAGRGLKPRATTGLAGLEQFRDQQSHVDFAAAKRVTIHVSGKGAPELHMRFSLLNIPSPALIAEQAKKRLDTEKMSESLTRFNSQHSSKRARSPNMSIIPESPAVSTNGVTPIIAPSVEDTLQPLVPGKQPIQKRLSDVSTPDLVEEPQRPSEELFTTPKRPNSKYHLPSRASKPGSVHTPSSSVGTINSLGWSKAESVQTPATAHTAGSSFGNFARSAKVREVPSEWLGSMSTDRVYKDEVARRPRQSGSSVNWVRSPNDPSVVTPSGEGAPSPLSQWRSGMKITGMGNAPRKFTPSPQAGGGRGSLHVAPILIPPPSGFKPNVEIIQTDSPV